MKWLWFVRSEFIFLKQVCNNVSRDFLTILHTVGNRLTGTIILFYCKISSDSDIVFILLFYKHKQRGLEVLFETGKGNKKHWTNISKAADSLTQHVWNTLLSLHAFTGCDSTSFSKGKGKLKAIKNCWKKKRFQEEFMKLGES